MTAFAEDKGQIVFCAYGLSGWAEGFLSRHSADALRISPFALRYFADRRDYISRHSCRGYRRSISFLIAG